MPTGAFRDRRVHMTLARLGSSSQCPVADPHIRVVFVRHDLLRRDLPGRRLLGRKAITRHQLPRTVLLNAQVKLHQRQTQDAVLPSSCCRGNRAGPCPIVVRSTTLRSVVSSRNRPDAGLQPQMARVDERAVADNRGPLQDIAQLSDVAGPVILEKRGLVRLGLARLRPGGRMTCRSPAGMSR